MRINGINGGIGKISSLNINEEIEFRMTQSSSTITTTELQTGAPTKFGDGKLYGSYRRNQVETLLANQQTAITNQTNIQDKNTQKTQQEKPVEPQVANARLREIDSQLTAKFTDTGIVRSVSSIRESLVDLKTGEKIDGHYSFGKNGNFKIHTIHIYGDEQQRKSAGVYIPKEFSDVRITSKDTVVTRNPKSGEVILIAHVKISSLKQLEENMKTVRDNGTMYIGQIGGKGGEGDQNEGKTKGQGVHSHLSFFPSEEARIKATAWKKAGAAELRDFNSTVSEWLSDFKKFVTIK